MRPLNPKELLNVWEYGLNQPLFQRSLYLLASACPEMGWEAVAQLTVGERDARLLTLREWMFGSRLMNMADCPKCKERVEWETDIADIRLQPALELKPANEYMLEQDGYTVRFRLPNSIDISAAVQDTSASSATQKIITRCVIEASSKGNACSIEKLPDHILKALSRRMDELDPQADIRMQLTCPRCAHQWETLFDIASILWHEINHWAERMLLTVHRLAKAYGWSEQDILSMSPIRRQFYLELVTR